MVLEIQQSELVSAVWGTLEDVTDPELDEPITDMGFVERVEVADARKVEVDFRLPTYWCSPNFAFLMAFGIKQEIARLPWVREITVTLRDHCFGEQINAGLNSDRAFSEIFAEHCGGENLEAVQLKFQEKAFIRRQETVLLALQHRGYSPGQIVSMTLKEFDQVEFQGGEESRQKPRYRSLLIERNLAREPGDPVFPTWQGERIPPDNLRKHLGDLRSVRINMEFNGALCRGLKSTRYKEVEISADGPTLVDFIHDRVPPDPSASTGR
ncbi:iron-sulfur cluster assembly protein [Roseibium marinum]|uniref:Metal-sulfur cluster biosynthetic enzyme n=1 Tax=Roseibium marinum TaxID=281252 RepID=A0A2S3UT19_9HYPH|nr:iron-sulfur cluster assembly protein [Roseibium marinum]POF30862.1 metal-sulfur cluster biosynthetic enzyme [Roseibium marinum]